jgi:phosphoribosylglycinamide formyltransferase-1
MRILDAGSSPPIPEGSSTSTLAPARVPGTHSIARALEHGVRVTGCTVHLVDAGVDQGPILDQTAVAVHADDTLESLTARMHAAEHALYARAVRAFLTRPFTLEGRRVTWQ